jgi:LmbE family N-acetylglucosaminyl deacetylase
LIRRSKSEGGCALLKSLLTGAALLPNEASFGTPLSRKYSAFTVLLVVAHPDDESECAATLYRITHELGGTVDQVVVTNGEAGTQYSAPAQVFYGLPLDEGPTGRKRLARIRRQELLRASRVLGIRHNYLFDQKDTGLTSNPREGLYAWNVELIQQELFRLMEREEYDLVLILLPSPDTHGHHQAVAQLTLEVVANLEPQARPAVLGVRTDAARFSGLEGFPLTRTTSAEPAWSFDRRTPLHSHHALDYSIIVNWVIAEHKSQGSFQMEFGRSTHEHFWLFEAGGQAGAAKWREFLQAAREHSRPRSVREEEFAKAFRD